MVPTTPISAALVLLQASLTTAAFITKSRSEWLSLVGNQFETETFNNLDSPPGDSECQSFIGDFTGLQVGKIEVAYLNSNPDPFRICGRNHSISSGVAPIFTNSVHLNPRIDDDDGVMAWTFENPINAIGFDVLVRESEPLDIYLVNDRDDFADVRVNNGEDFLGIIFSSSFNETVYLVNPNNIFDVEFAMDNVVWSDNGVAPPPTAAPTPAPPKFELCFAETTMVQVRNKGEVPIGQVSIGDYVESSLDGHFSLVYSLAHYAPYAEAMYLKLQFSSGSAPLEISDYHMIGVKGRGMVTAKNIRIGDVLYDNDMVVSVTKTHSRGLYAPFTMSGQLVVNGKVASNYIAPLDDIIPFQHWMAHALFWWRRVVPPTSETYSMDGLADWLLTTLEVVLWISQSPATVQLLVVIVSTPFVFGFLLLEAAGPMVVLLTLLFLWSRAKTPKKILNNKSKSIWAD